MEARVGHSNRGEAPDFFSAVQQLTLWVLADSRGISEGIPIFLLL